MREHVGILYGNVGCTCAIDARIHISLYTGKVVSRNSTVKSDGVSYSACVNGAPNRENTFTLRNHGGSIHCIECLPLCLLFASAGNGRMGWALV